MVWLVSASSPDTYRGRRENTRWLLSWPALLSLREKVPACMSVEDGISMLEVRCALLTPILTACYTHHGGIALKALEGLANKTNFFCKIRGLDWCFRIDGFDDP
mmetsp:Transcript_33158/g.49114  ORF Transcript_33158/g.49114 Transcript_33158/m.49114 type:complete len:104 (-) Transcript_33158:293-604(-)